MTRSDRAATASDERVLPRCGERIAPVPVVYGYASHETVTGLVHCCSTLGWVTPDVAFDHRWDTSRPFDEYVNERAPAWEGLAAANSRGRDRGSSR